MRSETLEEEELMAKALDRDLENQRSVFYFTTDFPCKFNTQPNPEKQSDAQCASRVEFGHLDPSDSKPAPSRSACLFWNTCLFTCKVS